MPSTSAAQVKIPAKPEVDLHATFEALNKILRPYENKSDVQEDGPHGYSLYTKKKIYRNKQVYFAGVKTQKNYVSFFLMTVYGSPEQQKSVSPALKKRMQGKACFNFTCIDPALLKELRVLVKAGSKKFLDVDQLDVAGMKCD